MIMKKVLFIMAVSAMAAGCADNSIPKAQLPELDLSNPLLAAWDTPHETPPFSEIKLADYEPAFDAAIACSRAEIDAIVNNPKKPTFGNTIVALERQGELLNRIAGLFFNLLEADTSDEMQQIAQRVQPKLTELSNDISLNPELFARVKQVYEHPGRLRKEDRKLLEDTYQSFARSGAALSDADKELYRKYTSELSGLTLRFGQNALAATNAFTLNITDPKVVAELPAFVREGMAAEAKARGEKGWTVTLQHPSYLPFMTYSSNRELKEKLWKASNSRALGGEFDNTEIVKKIANTRLKIANLLGYKCYADYVLERRMAENTKTVNDFLAELLAATKSYADADYRTVSDYAATLGFKGQLMPWDWSYYTEKYKDEKYALNDELVKPYLKLENVKKGVFMLANKLYGLNFTPDDKIEVCHPDVTAYDVTDADGRFMAVLYLDFFPRESKAFGGVDDRASSAARKIEDGKRRSSAGVAGDELQALETAPVAADVRRAGDLHSTNSDTPARQLLGEGKYDADRHERLPRLRGTALAADGELGDRRSSSTCGPCTTKPASRCPPRSSTASSPRRNLSGGMPTCASIAFGMTDMAWHTLTEPFGATWGSSKPSRWPRRRCAVVPERRSRNFGHTSRQLRRMVTSGPSARGRQLSRSSRRRASSTARRLRRSARTSSRRAARSTRWNSTCVSAA